MVKRPKIHRISISVSAAQKRVIDRWARAAGLSTSAYVKSKALDDLGEQVLAYLAEELTSARMIAMSSVEQGKTVGAEHSISREERERQIAAEVRASLSSEDIEALCRLLGSESDSKQEGESIP